MDRSDSAEYAITLRAVDGESSKATVERIQGALRDVLPDVQDAAEKDARRVFFHDTPDRALEAAGVILRTRVDLRKHDVDSKPDGRWDLTWKWRGDDDALARHWLDVWSGAGGLPAGFAAERDDVGLERDVKFGRAAAVSRFAASRRLEIVDGDHDRAGDVIVATAPVLHAVDPAIVVSICPAPILEKRWAFRVEHDAIAEGDVALTRWSFDGDEARLWELSLRAASTDEDALARVDALMRALASALGPSVAESGTTKTQWAREHCPRQ